MLLTTCFIFYVISSLKCNVYRFSFYWFPSKKLNGKNGKQLKCGVFFLISANILILTDIWGFFEQHFIKKIHFLFTLCVKTENKSPFSKDNQTYFNWLIIKHSFDKLHWFFSTIPIAKLLMTRKKTKFVHLYGQRHAVGN